MPNTNRNMADALIWVGKDERKKNFSVPVQREQQKGEQQCRRSAKAKSSIKVGTCGDRRTQAANPSTDFAPPLPKSQPPSINEIPATPKTSVSNPYSYSRTTSTSRNESPSRTSEKVSPSPSLSSASLPSPSSISPGSTSPDLPRKRNPAFDKAKEKFSGGAADTTTLSTRPNLAKDSARRSASPSVGFTKDTKDSAKAAKTPETDKKVPLRSLRRVFTSFLPSDSFLRTFLLLFEGCAYDCYSFTGFFVLELSYPLEFTCDSDDSDKIILR
ncbi:hypothetical protein ANCCAN_17327 [Ancylostoma caninum]|uniref:Uncharacterized protein n=1 Tax=Ancylostoma caninum TaxID=29170 RepID=A0A368G1E2_ANCCA|nr:hypothetical protein ANCCAN_17327 [Ancylostoma caninum]